MQGQAGDRSRVQGEMRSVVQLASDFFYQQAINSAMTSKSDFAGAEMAASRFFEEVNADCAQSRTGWQAKKAPLGESCLDESRSGKRRGEEPQSQENALTAWL
jgi:hypothetical protein